MSTITYNIDGQITELEAKAGKSLLKIGLEAGLMIEGACGGNGFCTTCKCTVQSGAEALNALTDSEDDMGIESPERLTCQAIYAGDGNVVVEVGE
jgi:ferredoxin